MFICIAFKSHRVCVSVFVFLSVCMIHLHASTLCILLKIIWRYPPASVASLHECKEEVGVTCWWGELLLLLTSISLPRLSSLHIDLISIAHLKCEHLKCEWNTNQLKCTWMGRWVSGLVREKWTCKNSLAHVFLHCLAMMVCLHIDKWLDRCSGTDRAIYSI